MAVTISGMFGDGNTYFADSPVVIDIEGLSWPGNSPFNVVRVEVIYDNKVAGDFRCDTGGQTTATFDISSALRAIWADFDYGKEVNAAQEARDSSDSNGHMAGNDSKDYQNDARKYRQYSLIVYTEFLRNGEFEQTISPEFTGGSCAIGHLTEWERSLITDNSRRDVSALEGSNLRNGDASTKPHPTSGNPNVSPERVGSTSITSWVDVSGNGTKSVFYSASAASGRGEADSSSAHAPLVMRDSVAYVDFLFLNRRGAIETCSGMTKEAMNISTDTKQYSRAERPAFNPTGSIMAIGTDGRRSWPMSSGYVTKDWAEWWTMEFLGGKRKQWWMLWQGPGMSAAKYVPVNIEPAKKDTSIYDKAKQQMPHVDFTVTLALEG